MAHKLLLHCAQRPLLCVETSSMTAWTHDSKHHCTSKTSDICGGARYLASSLLELNYPITPPPPSRGPRSPSKLQMPYVGTCFHALCRYLFPSKRDYNWTSPLLLGLPKLKTNVTWMLQSKALYLHITERLTMTSSRSDMASRGSVAWPDCKACSM